MLFEFAEPADEYEKLWADAETIILDELSDEESSDSAIEFCHQALRRPGTTAEVAGLSQFIRKYPGIIDRVTWNASKTRREKKEWVDAYQAQRRALKKLKAGLKERDQVIDKLTKELIELKIEKDRAEAVVGVPLRRARDEYIRWRVMTAATLTSARQGRVAEILQMDESDNEKEVVMEEEVRKPVVCQMPSAAKKLAMSQQRFDPNLSIEAVAGSGSSASSTNSSGTSSDTVCSADSDAATAGSAPTTDAE